MSPLTLTKLIAGENPSQLACDIAERELFSAMLGDNHDVVGRQHCLVSAKKFSHQPFDAIADNRIPDSGRDRDAKPAEPRVVDLAENDELGGMEPFPFPREGQKLGAFGEAGSFRKAFSPRCG